VRAGAALPVVGVCVLVDGAGAGVRVVSLGVGAGCAGGVVRSPFNSKSRSAGGPIVSLCCCASAALPALAPIRMANAVVRRLRRRIVMSFGNVLCPRPYPLRRRQV
jgi:hypothetical protein